MGTVEICVPPTGMLPSFRDEAHLLFALEKAYDQHPDKLASSYSGARSCFNAFQLFPQISGATVEVM